MENILYFITVTQKEYREPSNWLFEKKRKKKDNTFTLVIMGGTLLSIDNFHFTLFYAVILKITLNFQFFSICIAHTCDMTRQIVKLPICRPLSRRYDIEAKNPTRKKS